MPLPPIHQEPYVEGQPFTWKHCRGWLTNSEAAELAWLAAGKKVLEIGTFCGKSAVAMAPDARQVVCIDPFVGYPGVEGMANTKAEALGNFGRAGCLDKIRVAVGTQEEVLPRMDLSDVEFVFYDADHSAPSTARGIRLLYARGLPETAVIAFHDYHSFDPGVVMAVDDWSKPKGLTPRVVDSLAVFDGTSPKATEAYDVMLGIPTNGQSLTYGAAQGLFRATWKHRVQIAHKDKSLLAACFNMLWCDALNAAEAGTITHVAFLHADIAPCDGWIDILIAEMEAARASFCSAVSPVKDDRGLTSTGLGHPGLPWSPLRRFAIPEILAFPPTFDATMIGHPDKVLLLNSGCWVADLRDPKFFAVDEHDQARAFFTINDRVVKTEGKWVHQVESEDWFLSRRLHELGIKTVATRKVSLKHVGLTAFPNDVAWGSQKCDEDLRPLWEGGQP